LVREIEAFGCPLIEITGGEPLLQPDAVPLMQRLVDGGWTVLLETGGQIPIGDVPDEVMTILDVKCPSSGEAASTHWPNLDQVSPRDEVKFVLGDRVDFDYACDVIERHALAGRVGAVLLSPVHGVLAPADLACWMLERGVAARLHLQVHKYIWPPDRRGV
jgi:7-carboxy-7-deazaguanine synthase